MKPDLLKEFLNLIRFSDQTGTFLLYGNAVLGILVGGLFTGFPALSFFLKFLIGAFFARSAGCVINDIFDRKLDAKVERTKTRPLASGNLSLKQAFLVFFVMLLGGTCVLLTLPFRVFVICAFSLIPIFLYPLFKRFTHFPQIFLGLTYSIAFLAGCMAVTERFDFRILFPYLALAIWTVIYDTIYAIQDVKDDVKVGIKSTAVFFKNKHKIYLHLISILYIVLLLIFWHTMELENIIFPIVSFTFASFLIQKSNEENAYKIFKSSFFVIMILCLGILTNYF